jgi:hypothetical protein
MTITIDRFSSENGIPIPASVCSVRPSIVTDLAARYYQA